MNKFINPDFDCLRLICFYFNNFLNRVKYMIVCGNNQNQGTVRKYRVDLFFIRLYASIINFTRYKILRLKGFTSEEIVKKEVSLLMIMFCVLMSTSSSIATFHFIDENKTYKFVLTVVFAVVFLLCFLIAVVFSNNVLITKIINLFSSCIFCMSMFFCMYCDEVDYSFLFAGEFHFYFILVPAVNIFFELFPLMWILVYVLEFALLFSLDVVFLNGPSKMVYQTKSDIFMYLTRAYVCYVLVTLFLLIIIYYFVLTNKKERKAIRKLVKCVINLDFENDYVDKLLAQKVSLSKTMLFIKQIIHNFKLYEPYLPEVLKSKIGRGNDVFSSGSREASLGSLESIESNISSFSTDDSRSRNSSNRVSHSSKGSRDSGGAEEIYLNEKTILLLHLFVLVDYKVYSKKDLMVLYKDLTMELKKLTLRTRGLIVNSFGSNFYLCWNADAKSTQNEKKAAHSAIAIKKFLKNYSVKPLMSIHILKNAYAGNMGSSKYKRFNILSADLDFVSQFTRKNKKYGTNILLGKKLDRFLKYDFQLVPVKLGTTDFNFSHEDFENGGKELELENEINFTYELVFSKQRANGKEWMYVISDHLEEDTNSDLKESVFQELNEVWEHIKKKEFKMADEKLIVLETHIEEVKEAVKYVKIVRLFLSDYQVRVKKNE